MKNVYAELSEATHFGSTSLWRSHAIESEDEGALHTNWSSHPRWRSEEEALIACGQTLELADAIEFYLRKFFDFHINLRPASTS